ncbi:MAG: STAS domain-containing protein [Synergistaceae bacterium]|nr:STAS domain-containing protein [Synergistaceae bacterium]
MNKYSLTFTLQDEKIIFNLSGKIDSMNVSDLQADFEVIRKKCLNGSIIFNCKDLIYISSAGLRFFLHVQKQEKEKIKLINVSPEVFERFEITGFTEFFNVEKAPREISSAEVQKIGTSGGIEVFITNDDLLLKVYPESTDLNEIELERKISHAAFAYGIPTLISYDIVKFQERYGLLYEKLNLKSVAAVMIGKEKFYAAAMGKLLKQIHSFVPNVPEIPRVSELNRTLAQGMSAWLKVEEIDKLIDLINAIHEADTMLYYHFNPESIFVQNDELILINMTNIRIGNPLFDFARAYRPYQRRADFWKNMLHSYFGTGNFKKKERTIEAASLLGMAFLPASHKFFRGKEMEKERIAHAVELARRELFPNIKQIASLFAQYR